MRKKERTLAGYGTVTFERVREPCQVRRVLDAFLKQKSARMRRLGVPDVFAAAGVRRFIEAATTEQSRRRRAADRALRALGRRHHRRDHGRHCRRPALLRHVQFDRRRPLCHRKPGRTIDRQSGARLLRARPRHLRPRHRRGALQEPVLHRRRAAVRQLPAAQPARPRHGPCLAVERRRQALRSSSSRPCGQRCARRADCAPGSPARSDRHAWRRLRPPLSAPHRPPA